jgi:hypothetical protein
MTIAQPLVSISGCHSQANSPGEPRDWSLPLDFQIHSVTCTSFEAEIWSKGTLKAIDSKRRYIWLRAPYRALFDLLVNYQ